MSGQLDSPMLACPARSAGVLPSREIATSSSRMRVKSCAVSTWLGAGLGLRLGLGELRREHLVRFGGRGRGRV